MANTLAAVDIAISVATSLNDYDLAGGFTFVRWTQTELAGYLSEALVEITNYRPEAFLASIAVPIPLVPGTVQTIPDGYRLLKSIYSNGSATACPDSPITQCDLELMRTFYKAPCTPTNPVYRVVNYAYDAKNPLVFYVSPPVPAGDNNEAVNGVLVQDAPAYTFASGAFSPSGILPTDPMYNNTIKFWMLARCYEVDTESSTSQAESEKFYKKFYNSLGVQYKQTSDYNSGKYIGQGGDNNMTKQRAL